MARMQRWKRSRSAGEGTGPDAEVDEHTDEELDVDPADEAGEVDEAGEAGEVDEVGEVELVEEPDPAEPDVDLDPAAESDEDLEDLDDDVEELDEELDEDLDDELDELPEDGRPLLPSATDSRFGGGLLAVQLLQAAHAKQAITTALAMGLAAAVSGRPARETAVVLLTVLVGQTILGWHNDIVDRQRDQAHGLTGKPVAMGRISTETLWYALFVAALLLVPLAITTGIKAGCLYLASVAVGLLGNVVLRTGFFSWWSWAASYALLPAYLSFGGWGGQAEGNPPEPVILVLAALLGIGVHFMRAVWGLVADHEDGWTYLPLKLGLKLGATRLLALSTVYTAIVAILIAVMGAKVGLSK
ncbi:4-hydroxybenzoate polyprenyltransferase [Nocardioides aromaticivorans]|uniref:4-hydroxybenzoate polyprenyltransferase n=1 Tax=Nocardioides aromaticivorans TaxID=200618 RepID=A0A7Y9ZHE8_9ACTN|nr:UbiA family prenyltransferase [Nocardioides aromaticivorans]NYI44020.1 4-hydroxybenzoate polyprenyltransferase [Nocardioides aromaticivorans]